MAARRESAYLGARPHLTLLMAALCWFVLANTNLVRAQPCPSVGTAATARTTRGYVVVKVVVGLRKGSPSVSNAAIKVSLPQGISPVVGSKISIARKGLSRTIEPFAGGLNVYFTGLHLRKSAKLTIKAKLSGCKLPPSLAISTLFYQLDSQGEVVCAMPRTVNARVKNPFGANKRVKNGGCTTPGPTLPPSAAPFVPFGIGQRCLEAGRLAPWNRRELGSSDMDRSLSATISTPEQCWSYCSINGGTPAPFYFNWKTTTSQCFCCGGECTLIKDPNFTAYLAQASATAVPTSTPTLGGTLTPTSAPTPGPTSTPTMAPSSVPTISPSSAPSIGPTSAPTLGPTSTPTMAPSSAPTLVPTVFNTTGSRRRLAREEASGGVAAIMKKKDESRRAADEQFQRDILATQRNLGETARPRVPHIGANFPDNSKVAIVTFLTESPEPAYHAIADYEAIFPLTSASLERYADRHGYKLFVHREPSKEKRQAYWEKMDIIRKALVAGFDWVLYTDIDVLILDYDRPLQDFMVNSTIITVNEWDSRRLSQTPRSGFFLVRNDARAHEFLDVWSHSFEFYKDIDNPEQSSLEAMYKTADWRDDFYLHDWSDFHSYDTVNYGLQAFSMHFPGKLKVYRVARVWLYLQTRDTRTFAGLTEEETKLTEYAARLLREHLDTKSVSAAVRMGLEPHPEDSDDVEQCLWAATAGGYQVSQTYDKAFHAYTELYMILDTLTHIPSHIFITVPDKTSIPETVEANIQSWRDRNPGFDVVVHDDRDLEVLVDLLVPELRDAWPGLLNIQRADVYRFVVITFLGGVYADSDTVCQVPVTKWTAMQRGLVVGVEAQNINTQGTAHHDGDRTVVFAQYVFAASAFHPVLMRMLRRIIDGEDALLAAASSSLDPEDRLRTILRTTGPTAWTDEVAEYLCYAQAGRILTPDIFWRGGAAPQLDVLPISSFGAGQTHSGAPLADHSDVLVFHSFQGSIALRGEEWKVAIK